MADKTGFFRRFFTGKRQRPNEFGVRPLGESGVTAPGYYVGERIGRRYEVVKILGGEGRSGMGVVYIVYDYGDPFSGLSALKTFQDRYLASATVREAFRQEALAWVGLERHPYIVRANYIDELSGRLFIFMDYIAPDEGGRNSLSHYLTGVPLSTEQALRWAIPFCHGMEHAQAKGIACHRDIKPENVLISVDGVVKIADFGLARAVQAGGFAVESTSLQEENGTPRLSTVRLKGGQVWCGTPGYLAPEIVQGAEGDVQSDLYAFGLVLHQMASGHPRPPFLPSRRSGNIDDYVQEIHVRQMREPPPRFDTPLWPMIERCLRVRPQDRYCDFADLRGELEVLLRARTGEVLPIPTLTQLEAWEWSNKGYSLDRLGRHEEALGYFDRALAINPRDDNAWGRKGAALYLMGRYEESLDCCDRALALNQLNVFAWCNKGNALDSLGRPAEALRYYDHALKLDPRDAGIWYNKAIALKSLGRHEERLAATTG